MSRLHRTFNSSNGSSLVIVTAIAAALGSTLTGCGAMPTAPTASALTAPPAGSPNVAGVIARMPADPGEGGGGGGASDPPSASPAASSVATTVLTSFTGGRASGKSVTSQGADISTAGGTLTNGRWTLTVPANALAAGAHFTLSVSGSRGPACQVQVTPADATILAPLTLSVDCHGVPVNRIASLVILAYEPTTTQWTPVDGGSSNHTKHSVSVPIDAPGVYGAGYPDGRAGW